MTPLQSGIMHCSFGVALLWAVLVNAEPYIAGQAGVAFPQALSDGELDQIPTSTTPEGTKSSNLDLANSGVYGAKVGYDFESLKWLGIEGEIFQLAPNVKQPVLLRRIP